MPIESVMPCNLCCLMLCRPLLLPPSIPPSISVFSNESALHIRWPKCWSFSFSISPSHEYPGLISFRMDWLDLLAVQGTLKSLLQHHTSKASIHNYYQIENSLDLVLHTHIHTHTHTPYTRYIYFQLSLRILLLFSLRKQPKGNKTDKLSNVNRLILKQLIMPSSVLNAMYLHY